MLNNFKIKKHWIFTVCMLFVFLSSYAQNYSDQEIGLDVERISLELQKRGITDPEDILSQINQMREIYQRQYLEIQKNKDELLQRKPLLKAGLQAVIDISQSEKDALKALYDNTEGDNWTNKTGWDFSTPVTSWNNTSKTGWYGIIVTNGHVSSLDLYNNNLKGQIPTEIGKLIFMERLYLHNNFLSGPISSGIFELKSLKTLYLRANSLSGSIPLEIEQLNALTGIAIGINNLDGNIPNSIGTLNNLSWLQIELNNFSGPIPDLSNLQHELNITYNKFRFVDFANQFQNFKTKFITFKYAQQNKTDTQKTVNSPIGQTVTLTMYEDNKFTNDDTFQWYKNGAIIAGATSRTYIISNLKSTDSGIYICRSLHTGNPDMSPLFLDREPVTLNVVNCTPIIGTLKTKSEELYSNVESDFSLETTAPNLTYSWSAATKTGEIVNSNTNTTGLYSYKFAAEGDYILTLIVTNLNGCTTTFTKDITVKSRFCAKEPINFVFETTFNKLNYTWSSTNSSNMVINKAVNTTGEYKFIPELPGEYEIKLTATGEQNCDILFSKQISVKSCDPYISCTKTNTLTPEIHRLFIALTNKLANTPNGTDPNSYASKEIAALSPYTTDQKAKIYNFANTSTQISFSFSETAIGNDVQLPKSAGGSITNIDLSKYENAATKISSPISFSNGSVNVNDGYVRNINFCPQELSCVSHVALVVDESGSIAPTEANKIKKQLKAFVLQQALTNDTIGSNIYVSLTGMSDSDENTRTDFIKPTKLTNTPASLNQFNRWIDALGNRNGKTTGVSASSDYWRSGLEGALGYSMKPNMVVMITDGCQTADVLGLKATMKKFNNAPGSNPALPHLYVVGIEKGFYVDENYYVNLSPNQDPNSNQNLVNTLTTHLVKSLKYLFDFPQTQFPKSDINQFDSGTYFGHPDFSLLASDDTYFSDKLINAHIICGTPSIKDFCDDCFSFKPEPGKDYMLTAWVKEELFAQVKTYENAAIKIVFYNNKEALDIRAHKIDSLSVQASGNIIDGWQRIVKKFKIPTNTITIGIQLENNSPSIPVYFDDIRIHPLQGSVKSFVYDPETFKLMSELDENNYGTFYEYDNEGGLVRVKKETEKGIKTIQETRSGSVINTN
ncbi:hypothetical protein SD960_08405 [Flavobacterium sp. MMLR14_040]|uniref:hypothetical protein n=1 Tax=Flavobacterium sp. MMLR14_040 TaxID=3093843 RepID=UPI00298F5F77|nr:hypothetical protein [Flavobacterium sp. MMLR14_040]MDW8850108.1 hypothetical protein [Flavobacterium sp. MMLR14_040]